MTHHYSVVIPAFNCENTLTDAVLSVLAQTAPPTQIIIIDDGSTDGTQAVAASLPGPITIRRQDNQGPGAATTAGISLCNQPFIATLDADDIWLPNKIERQFEQFAQVPDLKAVFCRLANFYADPAQADFANARGGWSRSTMLIKRETCDAIGPIIDPIGRAGEMIDWFARGLEQGFEMMVMDDALALRRIHQNSLTYSHKDLGKSYLHVARAAMMRRRAAKAESVE